MSDGKYFLFFDPDTVTDHATGALSRYLPDGTLDTTFNFSRGYKTVNAVTPVGNGQFYVSATRYGYGSKDAEQILRINADGSIDPAFAPATVGGTDSFPDVWQIIVQPDGKVLVAGLFFSFGGDNSGRGIVRLLADGSLDTSFAAVTLNGDVYAAALQSDGKILISGVFSSVNGVTDVGVARLNANGTLDAGFQATGFARNTTSSRIRGIAILSDGQILLSGALRTGSGTTLKRYPIIRVSATGAFDATFDSSGVVSSLNTGRDFALQPDGKIVIVINNSVYRLNTNGSKDATFRQPVIVNAQFTPPTSLGTPVTVNLYANGQVLVGGIFTDVDAPGTPSYNHFGVARLNSDGTLDSSLVTTHHPGNEIAPSSFVRLNDGSTLVTFDDKIDPPIAYNLARLNSNGSIDPNFKLSSSDPNRFLNAFSGGGLEPLPDGKFFVYGPFSYGKIDSSGVEDTSFASNNGIPHETVTVASDGKIYGAAGSDFQTTLLASYGRLKATGEFDSGFSPGAPINGQVSRDATGNLIAIYAGTRVLAVQSDGKVLLQYFSQDTRFHLVRLNADGSLDGTFPEVVFTPTDVSQTFPVVFDPVRGNTLQPPNGAWTATPPVQDVYIQADGRIILTGHFTTFGNAPARGIVRIQPNGTIDNTFNVGGGMQWTTTTETASFFPTIENIEPTADGKFLVTGTFEAFNGTAAPGMAQLNADGSVDTSFVAPVHRDKRSLMASAFRAQPDGSFLLSGPYIAGSETATRSLIRLINAQPGAVNISTRLGVGTDENVLIEGFIVQGPAGSSKKILVRAIGPSLSQFGITDPLANPTLEIHDNSGATVATNNDWKSTQIGGLVTADQFTEINGSGAAPSNDLESAVIVPLAPGSYTAVVRGAGNSVGTGVVDAFDLDAGSSARLANIATRGLVQPGDKLMIAGFIVQNGAVKVVVRAIGPSLIDFGISNALPDTTVQLRDQQGVVVLENDDWKTGQAQELQNLGLQPSNDLEAALVTTIPPGQYTAQVRGKGNDSGIGVVQVYFLQ